jgi:2-keto-4-pentenoate hydratase/2-oxohepta-3-ene-1,7-dioic acid hydratase in catechol pathway
MTAPVLIFNTSAGLVRENADGLWFISREPAAADWPSAWTREALMAAPGLEPADLSALRIRAPVTPKTMVLVGLNYPSHAAEVGIQPPRELMFAPVCANAVAAPGVVVTMPAEDRAEIDYEGELAIVIGKPSHRVPEVEAVRHILGVTALVDLSARGVLMQALANGNQGPTIADSKSFAGFKPMGPAILLAGDDELEALDLPLVTHVNDEERQSDRTSSMCFGLAQILSTVSQDIPLAPGDVIATGTPAGVGYPTENYLRPGDRVSVRLGPLPPLAISLA